MSDELKEIAERITLRERARLGYELSTYAAAIRWDGSKNTQEWMDGLRERIEAVQSLAQAPPCAEGEE